jgi:hypothetical protein
MQRNAVADDFLPSGGINATPSSEDKGKKVKGKAKNCFPAWPPGRD